MARLTTAARNALPDSDFLGPNRTYPAEDKSHATAAESMSGAHASPAFHSKVVGAVGRKFPGLGEKAKFDEFNKQLTGGKK